MDQAHRSLNKVAVLVIVAALLCGCPAPAVRPPVASPPASSPSTGPVTASPSLPAAPAPGQGAPRVPLPPRENRLSPATRSLVNQANALRTRGDLDAASSTLDRALRIEPNNPLLWIERGRLRLAENDARQAENCGRKALALASGDRVSQKQAGRLLADALRAQRRNADAHEIESQPFMR